MNIETKKNIKEVINALTFCQKNDKKCKGCKDKNECLKFIRSSVAVCLQLLLKEKPEKLAMFV